MHAVEVYGTVEAEVGSIFNDMTFALSRKATPFV